MKKASLLASAAAATVVLTGVPAFAQGGPFADVPTDHWAYQAVDRLQNAGIVIGYPDGTYGGKRAMTRYEFAVAIARLLEMMPQGTTTTPPPAPQGLTEQQVQELIKRQTGGLASREEVDQLRRLVQEFQNELTTLGVDVDNIKRRLDGLETRVSAIEEELKRVRITGSVNLMARTNVRDGDDSFVDADGFGIATPDAARGGLISEWFNTYTDTRVLHDLDLGITARISDTVTAEALLNFGNYLPYINSVASYSGARSSGGTSPYGVASQVGQSQEQTIYKLAVEAPIRLPGVGGVGFSVGRIPVQFTPYTLKLIDTDSYFANDKTDLGDIPMDGVKATFKIGPVGLTALAAKTDPIKYVSDNQGNIIAPLSGPFGLFAGAGVQPFVTGGTGGVDATSRFITNVGLRPRGSLINPLTNGAMAVENVAGVRATFGAPYLGTVGLTYLALGGIPSNQIIGAGGSDFDRVYVWGADINTKLGPVGLRGSYTQSDMRGPAAGDPGDSSDRIDEDNHAWEAAADYSFGSVTIGGGYKEIGPYFAAPGYWGKLGSWTNPVDVKGPFAFLNWSLGNNLALAATGHFFEGADMIDGGLRDDDDVTHFRAGLKYGLTSASTVDLGVEWTEYDFAGASGKPREIFYNIGYGLNINPNASLKFLYQIVNYDDKGAGLDPINGDGGVAAAQFSVKF